jgi:NAD(P)H-dependent FMN reductase
MANRILVFYGSYRSDRMGTRVAEYVVAGFRARDDDVELIDAKAVALPMLDRMYKEHPPGSVPQAMETLASKIRGSDALVFVTGEYNWGAQPGIKNLTDHFLEEWFWRPAAIVSYSADRISGAPAGLLWYGTLSEMGMIAISSTPAVGRSRSRLRTKAGHWVRLDNCSNAPSHDSQTMSLGGLKLQRCRGLARHLLTELRGCCFDEILATGLGYEQIVLNIYLFSTGYP